MFAAWYRTPWVFVAVFLWVFIAIFTYNHHVPMLWLLYYSAWAFIILTIASATRASVRYKNTRYFIFMLVHASLAVPFLVPLLMLISFLITMGTLLTALLSSLLIAWSVFAVLFWLDARTTMQDYLVSCLRAGILVIYNYPFCLGAYLLLCLLMGLVHIASVSLGLATIPLFKTSIRMAGLMGSYIVYIAMLTNFYIKRVHDQFVLYYQTI
jgi:hypothetical protein